MKVVHKERFLIGCLKPLVLIFLGEWSREVSFFVDPSTFPAVMQMYWNCYILISMWYIQGRRV